MTEEMFCLFSVYQDVNNLMTTEIKRQSLSREEPGQNSREEPVDNEESDSKISK